MEYQGGQPENLLLNLGKHQICSELFTSFAISVLDCCLKSSSSGLDREFAVTLRSHFTMFVLWKRENWNLRQCTHFNNSGRKHVDFVYYFYSRLRGSYRVLSQSSGYAL